MYIASEELASVNRVRIIVHPDAIQVLSLQKPLTNIKGNFVIKLQYFSLLTFNEIKRLITAAAPNEEQAVARLMQSRDPDQEDETVRVPLLCGTEHPLTFPVYGKTCKHPEVFYPLDHQLISSVWIYPVTCSKLLFAQDLSGSVLIVKKDVRMMFLLFWITWYWG